MTEGSGGSVVLLGTLKLCNEWDHQQTGSRRTTHHSQDTKQHKNLVSSSF